MSNSSAALRKLPSLLLVPALLGISVLPALAAPQMIGLFKPGALAHWKHKSFDGETHYRLIGNGNSRVLEASCNASASAIAHSAQTVDLDKTPILRWQWRVDHVYKGLDGTTKAGDDYAARLYVIHDGGWRLWKTRAVNYVWANSQARGSHWHSPFTDKDMMVAVASGQPKDSSRWVSEARNVRQDFKQFYGLDLKHVKAVAIMTDCDNSGGQGRAYYRHIRFTAK